MYTITYNLRDSQDNSEGFYLALKAYSEKVYQELDEQLYDPLMGYFRYRRLQGLNTNYSLHEGYLEMLALGVLWIVYSGDALATGEKATDLLQKLAALRAENKTLKPLVDAFRGICLTAMMQPDLYDHLGVSIPSLFNFKDLNGWLEATGEFTYEAARLRVWEGYLETLPEAKAVELLELAISVGLWFEADSIEGLGPYTEHVDRYLNERRPKRYWKEDVIFCGRRRIEYHLNMLGSEWLNLAYKKQFDEKKYRLALLPTCMKLLSEEDCQAEVKGEWEICKQCNPSCQVGQLTRMEEALKIRVYMLAHNASLRELPEEYPVEELGILGVSCVLNLIEGGWMLADKGIPAQCVLLDYCGCKGHWHPEGMPTALHPTRLKELL